jgi:hypothetical protein
MGNEKASKSEVNTRKARKKACNMSCTAKKARLIEAVSLVNDGILIVCLGQCEVFRWEGTKV